MTYRPATTSNGMVFDAATCAWAALNSSRPWPTLDELHLVNLMTRNIFNKALGSDLYRFEKTKRGVVLNMGLPSMAPVED
jgi:hypothetical protein